MRIYFSGIGGVGIGPLAMIAHDAGHEVYGSDRQAGLITAELAEHGIEFSLDQSGAALRAEQARAPFDQFVYTSALPDDHPELVAARQLGIPTSKRDGFLAQLIAEQNLRLIAVAGTHGKTTTTGMLVWTLQQLGLPVSYSVGSTLSFGPSGKFDPASRYFVYECDEFDRNFLHFRPWLSLVTSIDYDHPDTYPTEADYLAAFRQFGTQSERVLTWSELAEVFQPDNVTVVEATDPRLSLAGEHNRRNGTLVLRAVEAMLDADADRPPRADDSPAPDDATIDNASVSSQQADDSAPANATILDALNSFPGTGRRFEKLADNLYSDYGHHPVEIAATLQLARELSDHVVLVYQPHQNVRQHEIRHQYADCMELAEEIYWLPTYLTREDPELPVLTPQQLTEQLTNRHAVHYADLDADLWSAIQTARHQGKLVLGMGAGTIDGWLRQQLAIKEVANVLIIDTAGNVILQQRDTTPGINNPGMITGFGGAVESGESVHQAAVRELREETNLSFDASDLSYFTSIYQPHVNDGQPRWVSYFVLKNQDISRLEVYEGAGYYRLTPETSLDEVNLSATTRQALTQLRQQFNA